MESLYCTSNFYLLVYILHTYVVVFYDDYCISVCCMNAGPFVSPEEIVARLVQIGLFDKAVDTALRFELPLDSIFEALASRLWFYM